MPSCLMSLPRIEVVFHLHNHLALLAVDHEFIGTVMLGLSSSV